MFKITYDGVTGSVEYVTEALAWRGVHELLEEGFDMDDDSTADEYIAELERHTVVPA